MESRTRKKHPLLLFSCLSLLKSVFASFESFIITANDNIIIVTTNNNIIVVTADDNIVVVVKLSNQPPISESPSNTNDRQALQLTTSESFHHSEVKSHSSRRDSTHYKCLQSMIRHPSVK